MVHADSAFRMGKTHLICQDYTMATAGEIPCALLADGCSSSPDTDMGARLLVRSALPYVACVANVLQHAVGTSQPLHRQRAEPSNAPEMGRQDSADTPGFVAEALSGEDSALANALQQYHQKAVGDARSHAAALHLPDTALDATLLTLIVSGPVWFASLFGDGVIAALNRDGEMEVTVVSYLGSYPYYPNYLTDAARHHALRMQKDNLRQVETFRIDTRGDVQDRRTETFSTDAPCPYVWGNVAEYRWVAALSDGVHSFYTARPDGERINTPLPLETVLPELLAFKSNGGQFAQRRMQKFQQQCAVRGWQHHDDIAMGAIAIEE